jgi:S-DNA-T family DNA segregation ATPase FtsK/SpoIIIE
VSTPAEGEATPEGVVLPFRGRAPEVTPGAEIEPAPEVLDGELLSDEENAAIERRKGLTRLVPTRVVVLVVKARESERGATVWQAAVGATGVAHVTCQGFESWVRRAWDASTMGVYRRQIKAAEAAGDRVLLAEWVERREQAVEKRHRRLVELPRLGRSVVVIAFGSVAGVVVLLLVLGVVVALSGAGSFLGPATGALTIVGWTATAVAFLWTPAVASVPLWVLLAAWREGRARTELPSWLSQPTASDGDVMDGLPDEGTIVKALHNLNIRGFNQALKGGWRIRFRMPPMDKPTSPEQPKVSA